MVEHQKTPPNNLKEYFATLNLDIISEENGGAASEVQSMRGLGSTKMQPKLSKLAL